jgi:hypothetical protein
MVASVTAVLRRFTTEWATQLPPEAIIGACEAAGYTSWQTSPKFPLHWWGINSTLSGHISSNSHQSRTAAGERL